MCRYIEMTNYKLSEFYPRNFTGMFKVFSKNTYQRVNPKLMGRYLQGTGLHQRPM